MATVSAASNRASLSSCISLLYVRGNPLNVVRSAMRWPYTLPVLPRMSSGISGFFFWGIILLPVQKLSEIIANPNSWVDHRTSSSLRRLRCIMTIEALKRKSITKSRSLTASMLFLDIRSNPRSLAMESLSSSNVVPARAALPSGSTLTLLRLSSKRSRSLPNIS